MCILRYMPAGRAVGVEDDRRVVVQARRAALEQRADDHHAVLAAAASDKRLARGAGNRLGLVEAGVVLALAGILPGEQLLQADDVRAGGGGLGDARHGLLDVVPLSTSCPVICTRATTGPADDDEGFGLFGRFELIIGSHGNLCPYDAQTSPRPIYYWHRHRRRQDLRRGADRPCARGRRTSRGRLQAGGQRLLDDRESPGLGRCAGTLAGGRFAGHAGSKSARRRSRRRWRRTWRPRPKGGNSTPSLLRSGLTYGSNGLTSCSSREPAG